jgi:hypothetical protein
MILTSAAIWTALVAKAQAVNSQQIPVRDEPSYWSELTNGKKGRLTHKSTDTLRDYCLTRHRVVVTVVFIRYSISIHHSLRSKVCLLSFPDSCLITIVLLSCFTYRG